MKIISGKYKGKKIYTLKKKLLKPTNSITKKILFQWLSPFIKNKICLDCFAGTGSLSLESLSRNAKHVTLIEKNYKISKLIKKNFKNIKNKYFKIYTKNSIKWLKKNKKKFNLIFIDPPYNKNYINKIIKLIKKNNIIKEKTFIYIETFKKNINIKVPKKWFLYKEKIKHSTKLLLYIIKPKLNKK